MKKYEINSEFNLIDYHKIHTKNTDLIDLLNKRRKDLEVRLEKDEADE